MWNSDLLIALGNSGSGKTCYMCAMKYVFKNHPQFALTMKKVGKSSSTIDLDEWIDNLSNSEKGTDRFPPPTIADEYREYEFSLFEDNNPIHKYKWIDYRGGHISDNPEKIENTESFKMVSKSARNAAVVYFFIDSKIFLDTNPNAVSTRLDREIGYLKTFFTTQISSSKKRKSVPVVFVLTKSDLLDKQGISRNQVFEMIKAAAAYFFNNARIVYMTAVSLGEKLADRDNQGEFKPVNCEIPVYIGIKHLLEDCDYSLIPDWAKKYLMEHNILQRHKELINQINRHLRDCKLEYRVYDREKKLKG